VADTGAGLPKDVRHALFRPLVSTKDPERGVGLGLHAARTAMRLQLGDLQLTESGDSGSTLTLVFARPAVVGAPSESSEAPASV
jgi:C4-dicarboxylate-specific signal transduction histidine kinase